MHKERIGLNDSMLVITAKLSEENPNALDVVYKLIREGNKIDPDAFSYASLLLLDSFGIYGAKIWVFYKYICESNLTYMMAVLRAIQLGLLPRQHLMRVLNKPTYSGSIISYISGPLYDLKNDINIPELLNKVKEQLPNFGKEQ